MIPPLCMIFFYSRNFLKHQKGPRTNFFCDMNSFWKFFVTPSSVALQLIGNFKASKWSTWEIFRTTQNFSDTEKNCAKIVIHTLKYRIFRNHKNSETPDVTSTTFFGTVRHFFLRFHRDTPTPSIYKIFRNQKYFESRKIPSTKFFSCETKHFLKIFWIRSLAFSNLRA